MKVNLEMIEKMLMYVYKYDSGTQECRKNVASNRNKQTHLCKYHISHRDLFFSLYTMMMVSLSLLVSLRPPVDSKHFRVWIVRERIDTDLWRAVCVLLRCDNAPHRP